MRKTASTKGSSSIGSGNGSLEVKNGWPMRLWLATPEWVFRSAGFLFFLFFLVFSGEKYWTTPWEELGPQCALPWTSTTLRMPWVPILVDLTFLLIAVSFLVRLRPRRRASNGWIILFTLLIAFVPLVFAVWLGPLLGVFRPEWQADYEGFLWRGELAWYDALVGGVLITVGNLLDVWGYLTLCRSFSIVPEARQLKTTGPYRLVRHPVYLGQFLAQAGVWLFFAALNYVWVILYVVFVVLQLLRSRLEDQVLAEAFGDEYLAWKERTFWFI